MRRDRDSKSGGIPSDHYKDDRSIDRHIWPKYGIPLLLWLYISSASIDRKSHTVMLSGYSLKIFSRH
jgi:hypothetical protein